MYIAVQGGKRRRPSTGSALGVQHVSGGGGRASLGNGNADGMGGGRREYLVVLKVEQDVQRVGASLQVCLPL